MVWEKKFPRLESLLVVWETFFLSQMVGVILQWERAHILSKLILNHLLCSFFSVVPRDFMALSIFFRPSNIRLSNNLFNNVSLTILQLITQNANCAYLIVFTFYPMWTALQFHKHTCHHTCHFSSPHHNYELLPLLALATHPLHLHPPLLQLSALSSHAIIYWRQNHTINTFAHYHNLA